MTREQAEHVLDLLGASPVEISQLMHAVEELNDERPVQIESVEVEEQGYGRVVSAHLSGPDFKHATVSILSPKEV